MKKIQDLNISDKHKQQLTRARKRGSNELFSQFILPTLKAEDDDMAVPHLFKRSSGSFMYFDLEEMIDECTSEPGGIDWPAVQKKAALFTNPLQLGQFDEAKRIPGENSGGTPPSERITNAGWWAYTFEYDGSSREELEMQLDWFRGKPETCPFSEVHRALSKYADYRGYSAVFSGNKSLHVHLLFDTRHLSRDLSINANATVRGLWTGDVPDEHLNKLHRAVWPEIAAIINEHLRTDVHFDDGLRSYVQKRRCPWGIRTLEKPSTLHGWDAGDQVEQVVLQERISGRTLAPKNALALATFEKSQDANVHHRENQRRPSPRSVTDEASAVLVPLFQSYLRSEGWGEFPKPVNLSFDGTHNIAFFKNDASDVHPSTLIQGDHRKLRCAGKGSPGEDLFLPNEMTLDETLDLLNPTTSSALNEPTQTKKRSLATPLSRFREQATDKASSRTLAGRILRSAASWNGLVLVQAPEGIGKTYSLMDSASELRWDEDSGRLQNAERVSREPNLSRGFTVISCRSYEQLAEKHDELLTVPNAPSSAVILKSVGQLYIEAIGSNRKAKMLTREEAGRKGYSSLIEAIKYEQPEVFSRMEELRDRLWCSDGSAPVFDPDGFVLMVHDLLKVWPHAFYTRAFLHPEFPSDLDPAKIERCASEMWAHRVIFDEVGWADLVSVERSWRVDLAHQIRKRCKSSGSEWDDAPLHERVSAYHDGLTQQGRRPNELSFDDCDGIIRTKFQDRHRVKVDTQTYPFGKGTTDNNIYARADGNPFYCKPRRWPQALDCPVIVLTTEDFPRLVLKGIRAQADTDIRITIINLTDTPNLFQDMVPIVFDERTRMNRRTDQSGNHLQAVQDLAEEALNEGFDYVISNGLSNLDQNWPGRVMSHTAARGRNDLRGKSIATLVTYPSVDEYEIYCVLGAAFGIPAPVGTAYRDMVFQDLGRNLGFRFTPGQPPDAHVVFIKASLFRDLNRFSGHQIPGTGFERYRFQLVASDSD